MTTKAYTHNFAAYVGRNVEQIKP